MFFSTRFEVCPEILSNILCYLRTPEIERLAVVSKEALSMVLCNAVYHRRVMCILDKLEKQVVWLQKRYSSGYKDVLQKYLQLKTYYDTFVQSTETNIYTSNAVIRPLFHP